MPAPFARILAIAIIVLGSSVVSGQTYPSKTVRVVAGGAGSGVDIAARLVTTALSGSLGQQFTVDNRPAGVIPGDIVAHAPPDGYTLMVAGTMFWLLPFLMDTVPYDPVKDFAPISLTTTAPNVLVVHPSLPVKSVKELIAFSRARPGKLNYAAAAAGSPNHLSGELFKSMARVNIVSVPYRGSAPSLTAIMGGEVELGFVNAASAMPLVKAGRLRALAVTTEKPSELAPGLPTVASAGLSGYESISMYGVFAPAKTPAAVVSRLNQEIVRLLRQPDLKEKAFNAGLEIVASTPEQYAAKMTSDMAITGKLIKDVGIRAD